MPVWRPPRRTCSHMHGPAGGRVPCVHVRGPHVWGHRCNHRGDLMGVLGSARGSSAICSLGTVTGVLIGYTGQSGRPELQTLISALRRGSAQQMRNEDALHMRFTLCGVWHSGMGGDPGSQHDGESSREAPLRRRRIKASLVRHQNKLIPGLPPSDGVEEGGEGYLGSSEDGGTQVAAHSGDSLPSEHIAVPRAGSDCRRVMV